MITGGAEGLGQLAPVLNAAVVEALHHALGVFARHGDEPEHRLPQRGAIGVVPRRECKRGEPHRLEVGGWRRRGRSRTRVDERHFVAALVPVRDREDVDHRSSWLGHVQTELGPQPCADGGWK